MLLTCKLNETWVPYFLEVRIPAQTIVDIGGGNERLAVGLELF
jgi:hypothetical protein